jgi:hypothetical protein
VVKKKEVSPEPVSVSEYLKGLYSEIPQDWIPTRILLETFEVAALVRDAEDIDAALHSQTPLGVRLNDCLAYVSSVLSLKEQEGKGVESAREVFVRSNFAEACPGVLKPTEAAISMAVRSFPQLKEFNRSLSLLLGLKWYIFNLRDVYFERGRQVREISTNERVFSRDQ